MPPTRPLTARQQQVLDTQRRFRDGHGRPPKVSELAALLGVSPQTVECHLYRLARRGCAPEVMMRCGSLLRLRAAGDAAEGDVPGRAGRAGHGLPPEPTAAEPGSEEKVAVMEARVAAGFAALHPLDLGTPRRGFRDPARDGAA